MGEQYKLTEYPLIILFIITGAIFLMSTNDLVSIFLAKDGSVARGRHKVFIVLFSKRGVFRQVGMPFRRRVHGHHWHAALC